MIGERDGQFCRTLVRKNCPALGGIFCEKEARKFTFWKVSSENMRGIGEAKNAKHILRAQKKGHPLM